MNALFTERWRWLLALLLLTVLLNGCATPKINWASRIGTYTYDQAVLELGPPDKQAKLGDGTTVAEWLTHRGYSYTYSPMASYSPWGYGPYYPVFADTYQTPDSFLRLTFGPDGKLSAWKRLYK